MTEEQKMQLFIAALTGAADRVQSAMNEERMAEDLVKAARMLVEVVSKSLEKPL